MASADVAIPIIMLACSELERPSSTGAMQTGKLLKQVVAGGFYNMWMANAFKRMGCQCCSNMARPRLSILAEHF